MDAKGTILLIEDEPDIRAVYSEVLMGAGYNVLEASDGKAGLDLALQEHWDICILDIMIPVLDGVHVLKIVKTNEKTKNKPVLLLTNVDNENLITEAFEYGAAGYLIKAEITPENILNEVTSYLNK